MVTRCGLWAAGVAVAVAGGCSQTVAGTAQRAVAPVQGRTYGYVDNRCGRLPNMSVKDAIGADHIVRPYSGAVCQYMLFRQSIMADVTFSWFETGSLDRERALAQQRGAQITETVVQGHQAILARRTTDPFQMGAACSATAGASPGVLSWWVQIRAGAAGPATSGAGDPCTDAEKLLAGTLSSDQ